MQAEAELARLLPHLDDSVADLRDIATRAARAEHAYEMARSKAFARCRSMGMSATEAKEMSLLDCEAEHEEFVLSAAIARSAYKAIDVKKSQVDGLRSLLVSARGVSS